MSAGIGQFTGTALHSGLDGTRNSSRVLAPPGGGCSDIFGTGPSYNANPVTVVAQQERNESSVFRSPARTNLADTKIAAQSQRNASKAFSTAAASPIRRGRAHIAATSSISNVFSYGPDSTDYTAPEPAASPRRQNVSNTDATAYAAPAQAEEFGARVVNNKNSEFHGYTSTQGPASGKSRAVHTSSKVMAPPGGRSQITFG